jgi:hypothetical protein
MTTLTASIQDRIVSAFDFSVDKFPLGGPEGMSTPLYGMFRSDNCEFVGQNAVKKNYHPHTTDDVLALTESASEAFDGIGDVKCYFKHGHHVFIQPSREDRLRVYGTNDNVFPRLVIRAWYGGKAFSASIGYYRDLCRNLAMLESVNSAHVSIRHDSNLRTHMDELIENFRTLREGWNRVCEFITTMESREVTLNSFLDTIYPVPSDDSAQRARTIHENRTVAIFNRVQNERFRSGRPAFANGDFTVSVWEAYNAVQGYNQHVATRRGEQTDISRVFNAMNAPAVRHAERHAAELVAVAA